MHDFYANLVSGGCSEGSRLPLIQQTMAEDGFPPNILILDATQTRIGSLGIQFPRASRSRFMMRRMNCASHQFNQLRLA